jgi:RNA polymerase sigma-70 factor (ECF subfamily)
VTLQRSESVTLAFLVMLETLSPEERAVFLLREVFDYQHDEIATMLGVTAANSRQIFHRAKERIRSRAPRSDVAAPASQREVLLRFTEALKNGDARALTDLLTEDVGFWSDGGGKVASARRPLVGRQEVLNLLVGLHRTAVAARLYDASSFALREVNGEPALLISAAGRLDSVFVLSVTDGRISAVRVARNPDKLRFIERQLQVRPM